MKKIVIGDVFTVPTGDGRVGVGQVVGTFGKGSYYFAIFEGAAPTIDPSHLAEMLSASRLLLLGLSLDGKIHAGHWTVIARAAVDSSIHLPAYKVARDTRGRYDVEDSTGTRRRRATRVEISALPFRTVLAPAYFERALRASLGLEPWLNEYDELRPDEFIRSSDIFK